MSNPDSFKELIDRLWQRAPELIDLATSQTDQECDAFLDTLLEQAIDQLEKNAINIAILDEEGLSSTLAMALSMPGLCVVQEGNCNGHVDITVTVNLTLPAKRRMIEAKIYSGPRYHVKGLDQLVGRYSTGREGRGWIIVYVKKKNIRNLMASVRKHLDDRKPCGQQECCRDHRLKWAFCSTHMHTSGELIEIAHFGCNLYIGQTVR